MLDFSLSPDQQAWKDKARGALEHLAPRFAGPLSSQDRRALADEAWQSLAAAGFFGAIVPRELGGSDEGLLPMCFAQEELAALGGGNNLTVLTTVATLAIATGGLEKTAQRFLPQIASGRAKFCLAVTEPEAGFNTLAIKTFARRGENSYTIDGSKIYISGADVADWMLLLARTKSLDDCAKEKLPKSHGLSAFVVDPRAPGIEKRPIRAQGDGGLVPFELTFNRVEVPLENRIGPEHLAALGLFAAFNAERILFSCSAVGMSRYCLDRACRHARERSVFKGPIGAYQSIQHPLAEVQIRQEAVRLAAYRAAWCFEQGVDPTEVSIHANSAKLLASELATLAVDAAINALGGKGFDEDFGIIQLLAQARLMKTSPISNALVLNAIAERVLELPRSY
ncbi:MAG: acyl-CoA dehydrogenase family protein [Pirellulales bacterium]